MRSWSFAPQRARLNGLTVGTSNSATLSETSRYPSRKIRNPHFDQPNHSVRSGWWPRPSIDNSQYSDCGCFRDYDHENECSSERNPRHARMLRPRRADREVLEEKRQNWSWLLPDRVDCDRAAGEIHGVTKSETTKEGMGLSVTTLPRFQRDRFVVTGTGSFCARQVRLAQSRLERESLVWP